VGQHSSLQTFSFEVSEDAMALKMAFALAAALTTNAGADRNVQATDALAESVSNLVRDMQGSLLALASRKFRVGNVHATSPSATTFRVGNKTLWNKPVKHMNMKDMMKMAEEQKTLFKKIEYVPASNPMWKVLRASIKQQMLDMSQDARDWIGSAAEANYDFYLQKSCNFFGGAEFMLEKSTGKMWPTDAFWCGNPGIDWSGSIYGGKPVNDYCGAAQGDVTTLRAEAQRICGKYTDKEIVLSLTVSMKADPRDVNVMMSDCLMDEIDADINYCHKCGGRCSGGSIPAAAAPAASPDTPDMR